VCLLIRSEQPSAELVITAPQPFGTEVAYLFRCRTTLGVLAQLLAEAKQEIVLAAPFMQPGEGLSAGPLADALAAALRRGVHVSLVSTHTSLNSIDHSRLRENARGNLRFYQPEANKRDERVLGSHAKFCIADHEKAYVGSANLTGPGLAEHLEMGVLLHGDIVQQIEEFWLYAVDAGFFVPLE
jgi:phosphatidylserine/phosphatidylglycerophosphate/cardiolipin synthase-like enzyme